MHSHVCSVDILWSVSFVRKKKNSLQMCSWKRQGTYVCVRSPQALLRFTPPLCKAQCRVTQISSGNCTQTGPHRHPQAHKHTESRTHSSAGAKVNRWAGLNWLAVCSDCKLRWWWLENSSTGCRLLKLSRENNFLLCSGNFFFPFFFYRAPSTPPSLSNLNIMGLHVRRWKKLVYKLV